jgi:hypothetical protein
MDEARCFKTYRFIGAMFNERFGPSTGCAPRIREQTRVRTL